MSSNIDNDRSVTTGKMYPIDLAPQKITIVKSVSNSEVKMTHLISGQPKISGSSQLSSHGNSISGLMRPGLAQIISPNSSTQPQMIISGSPILQGTQIVSQGSQLHSQSSQTISQSQILPGGQLLSPGTQIISQGTQLSAQLSTLNSNSSSNNVTNVPSTISGVQVLNVANQLGTGASNLLVNPSVRTLPPTVRVLPPLGHHNTRPAGVQLSNVTVTSANNVLVNKGVNVGATSHVPRGLAAVASLALRPVTPSSVTQPTSNQSGAWGGNRGLRGGLMYNARPRVSPHVTPHVTQHVAVHVTPHVASHVAPHASPVSAHQALSAVVTLSTASVLNSTGVISGSARGATPRTPTPSPSPLTSTPRPLPLLQRNYQPAKVVGVSTVGVRGVGNSAPAQLYYEVPRAALPAPLAPHAHHAPLAAYSHAQTQQHQQVNIVNASAAPVPESNIVSSSRSGTSAVSVQTTPLLAARPTILRKRDIDGSPTKLSSGCITVPYPESTGTGWEDVVGGGGGGGSGGSTTMSASSSPPREEEPEPAREEHTLRKKPRKQLLGNDVRQCEFPPEEAPSPPPASIQPPPKRPLLSSSYVCGWRSTALHFVRPADVRRRDAKPRDIVAIASQKHVLTSAEGWKVHHLTAQMDDLMSLESDVGSQLAGLLRALEHASGKALAALQPHSHSLLELLKGNIQRSKIVCEGIQEGREDILRVFTHRQSVSDILTRQADKRCFRKHRSQS